jgi:DNA recombination protein RmuC
MGMEISGLTLLVAAVALVAVIGAVIAATRARAAKEALEQRRAELAQQQAMAAKAQEDLDAARADRIEATTRLASAEATIAGLEKQRGEALAERDTARTSLAEAEKTAALAEQARAAMVEQQKTWEAARAESLGHAKAAVLNTAQQVSSKLIADHKREAEAAKKQSEEQVKKTTENLTRHFEGVAKSVASLQERDVETRQRLETVWRSLSSPGGAGDFSEMGLENALSSFGLVRDIDFKIQHTIDDATKTRRLRPDAIVFMPDDRVLVIDSKASKFLLELAEAEGTDHEAATYDKFAKTMDTHLKDLVGKDYKGAIADDYRASGRANGIVHVTSVMYLPNEGAIEKLGRASPGFVQKARKQDIILAGPAGLASVIGLASVLIDVGRQAESQEHIVAATGDLLESVGVVIGHVDKMGKGIGAVAKNYANLSASINSRLLPRARKLAEYGVRPAKNKKLPDPLAAYKVEAVAASAVIEGEAEEIAEDGLIEHAADQTSSAAG